MDFQQAIEIKASAERVYAYFERVENQGELHPLIHAVRLLSDTGEGSQPRVREYEIEETVPFLGIFKMPNRYQVRSTTTDNPQELHFDAFSKPNVQLRNVLTFEPISAETMRVTERVSISAPALLRRFVISTAKKAHTLMLSRLKEVMEQ